MPTTPAQRVIQQPRQQLAIPPLWSPFASAIHPAYADIERNTASWVERLSIGSDELRSRAVQHGCGVLAARILPDGDQTVVQITSDLAMWVIGIDDGYCEESELHSHPGELTTALSRLLRVAQTPQAPMLCDDPLANGLRDLHRRIGAYATPTQQARWIEMLREYFFALTWEAHYRQRGTVPSLNDYTTFRLPVGSIPLFLPLMEIGHGYELHPSERDNMAVQALVEMAYFVSMWDNDILSHHKERQGPGHGFTILEVLEQEHCLEPNQALAEAIAQRDRVLLRFLHLREEVSQTASPHLRRYLHSLGRFIQASLDWEMASRRFTSPEAPANLPTTTSDTPTDDSTEPLPIPSIAWWWQV